MIIIRFLSVCTHAVLRTCPPLHSPRLMEVCDSRVTSCLIDFEAVASPLVKVEVRHLLYFVFVHIGLNALRDNESEPFHFVAMVVATHKFDVVFFSDFTLSLRIFGRAAPHLK